MDTRVAVIDVYKRQVDISYASDLQFSSHAGIQLAGSRRIWCQTSRTGSARFHYADRISGMLWTQYVSSKFHAGIS